MHGTGLRSIEVEGGPEDAFCIRGVERSKQFTLSSPDLACHNCGQTRQGTRMIGYILFRTPEGDIHRFEAERASRRVLRTVLEDGVSEGDHIIGVIFGPRTETHLKSVAAPSPARRTRSGFVPGACT